MHWETGYSTWTQALPASTREAKRRHPRIGGCRILCEGLQLVWAGNFQKQPTNDHFYTLNEGCTVIFKVDWKLEKHANRTGLFAILFQPGEEEYLWNYKTDFVESFRLLSNLHSLKEIAELHRQLLTASSDYSSHRRVQEMPEVHSC